MSSRSLSQPELEEAMEVVRRLAHNLKRNLPPHVDEDDLVSEGFVAICKAADRYDPEKASWSSYVYLRAHGAMRDWMRSQNFNPRTDPTRYALLSFQQPVGSDDGEATLADIISDGSCLYDLPDPVDAARVQRALRELTPYEMTVVELIFFEGYIAADVARMLDVSESMINHHTRSAYRRMAKALG